MTELENITQEGIVPETRIASPMAARAIAESLWDDDEERRRQRGTVQGLADGNRPYDPHKLREANQSFRTNVNWREAESFLQQAVSAFYDIFAESENYATVDVELDNLEDSQRASGMVTEAFDALQKSDDTFDYTIQIGLHNMVLHGCGPIVFNDPTSWKCDVINAGDILLPSKAKSHTKSWEIAVIKVSKLPSEIYQHIKNESAARTAGWDVEEARHLMVCSHHTDSMNKQDDWEDYQEKIRNNDLFIDSESDEIDIYNILFKEFDGTISQVMVSATEGTGRWLYRKQGKYKSWDQIIHPFYYDRGTGTHHSVKGLGIKMFGALEIKNRLTCSVVDAAFQQAQTLLSPNDSDSAQQLSIAQMGPFAVLPPGFTVQQNRLSGVLEGPIAVGRQLESTLQSNLSQYRQRLENQLGANPRSATEIQAIVAQASTLGKTQLQRFYEQLDAFYSERFKRALKATDEDAKAFQAKIKGMGISLSALKKAKVTATRSVGAGSASFRQLVLQGLMQYYPLLPESGRNSLVRDIVSATAGYSKVQRYMPGVTEDPTTMDAMYKAVLENNDLRTGGTVPVLETQLHETHAQIHVQAAYQSIEAIQAGADPMEIAEFLSAVIDHTSTHVQFIKNQQAAKAVTDQLQELSKASNELVRQAQEMQEQVQQQQQVMNDEQLKVAQAQAQIAREDAKAEAQIRREDARAGV